MFNVSPPEERSENADYVKPIAAPKPLQDGSDSETEPLDTVDLSTDPSVQKQVFISSRLSTEEK